MSQSPALVHIVDDVPELAATHEVTMVVALDGFLDAGNAASLATQHLLDAGNGRVVATFDLDQLYDYRARRPPMVFNRDHYEAYEPPRLTVRLCHDTANVPFLVLSGPEPDHRWEGFIDAVARVVEQFRVSRVVGLGAVPMAVPHTRPAVITPHANQPGLVAENSPWSGELRIPSSAQALLEIRLGEQGHPMLGYVVHVPHYLAQMSYPRATVSLLEHTASGGELGVDLAAVQQEAERQDADIARYLASNEEVAEVVQGLEQQYDAYRAAEGEGSDESLLAEDQPLPSGDELGAQFQEFLAGLDDRDDNRPGDSA